MCARVVQQGHLVLARGVRAAGAGVEKHRVLAEARAELRHASPASWLGLLAVVWAYSLESRESGPCNAFNRGAMMFGAP